MNIHRYTSSDKPIWDAFVRASKNGTFLFERDYMDYHRDRFFDHSLMFLDDKGRLVALLPANEVELDGVRHLYSHQGLTYGGFVLSTKNTVEQVIELFDETVSYPIWKQKVSKRFITSRCRRSIISVRRRRMNTPFGAMELPWKVVTSRVRCLLQEHLSSLLSNVVVVAV